MDSNRGPCTPIYGRSSAHTCEGTGPQINHPHTCCRRVLLFWEEGGLITCILQSETSFHLPTPLSDPTASFLSNTLKTRGPARIPHTKREKVEMGSCSTNGMFCFFFTNPYIQNPQVYVGAAFKASLSSEDIEMHRIYVPELIVEEVFLPTLEPKQPNSPLTLECKVMGRRGWKWGIRRRWGG